MNRIIRFLVILTSFACIDAQSAELDKSKLDKQLNLFIWEEYMDPAILKQFEQEFGVKVIETHFTSNEEMVAKLKAGGTGYDVVSPSDYTVSIMTGLHLLKPLNHKNIPNIKHIGSRFSNPEYDAQNQYSIPYLWGVTGIGYNKKLVKQAPSSWSDIFDEKTIKRYRNRISMLNDMREVIGSALLYLGYSPNSTDPKQLDQAKVIIEKQKQYLAKYDSESFEDSLASGELAIAHGWSGEVFTAQKENPDLGFSLPKEGMIIFVDTLAIPASSKKQYTAEIFINFLMRPEISARIANFLNYPTPNQSALSKVDKKLPGPNLTLPEGTKTFFIRDLGEQTKLYEKIWTEVKGR